MLQGASLSSAVASEGRRAIKYCIADRLGAQAYREEQEGRIPGPPSYSTRRMDGIPVPVHHKCKDIKIC